MELPIIGHTSIADILYASILVIMLLKGCLLGFAGELRGFVAILLGSILSLQPGLHGETVKLVSRLSSSSAEALAHLFAFCLGGGLVYLLLKKAPAPGSMSLNPTFGALSGGLLGLLKAFMLCSMIALALGSWDFWPDWLQEKSYIAEKISLIWKELGLMPVLHSPLAKWLPQV